MPRFENDRIDLVLTKRLVLFGGTELQHTLQAHRDLSTSPH